MHVAIDARYVGTSEHEVVPSGGIGRYVHQLVLWLLELDPELRLTLVVPAENRRAVVTGAHAGRVRELRSSAPPQSLRTLFCLARTHDFSGVDVLHCPANVLPLRTEIPAVTTIHDLMWLDDPELCASSALKRLVTGNYYRAGITHAARASAEVLTVSVTSARALLARFPELRDHLTVTHHGLEPGFALDPAVAEAETAHIIPPAVPFVLCVGQGSPYKNHGRAVAAFAEAFASEPAVRLVLVRRFTRRDPEIGPLLAQPNLRGRVSVLPQISERELRALHARARIFLFPSLCEGFGMPPLEAMASGVPVLTANFGAMAEVCGDAALGVDTRSVAAIAGGLRALHEDDALRGRLVALGRERAASFSWRACAERTLAVYRRAARSRASG